MGAGPLVQGRRLVRVLGEQAGVQDVTEKVVIAVPGTLSVERDHEQVAALEVLEHPGAVGVAGDGVTQWSGESLEHGCAEQEVADLRWLPGEDLVGQVVDDEPVAPRERLDERGGFALLRHAAQGERGELEAGDPALRPLVESDNVIRGEVQAHRPVEELLGLGSREPEVGRAYLDELPTTTQPRQRQRRVGARRHHQVQLVGQVLDEEGHGVVHLGCLDHLVVVEHQDPPVPCSELSGEGDIVDERSERSGGRAGARRLENAGVDLEAGAVQRGGQVSQQAHQVVVALVEGEPSDSKRFLQLVEVGEPVAEHGGLAEPGGRGQQREPMASDERGVEVLDEPRARNQLSAPGRREQLGREDRGRHLRIIGAGLCRWTRSSG